MMMITIVINQGNRVSEPVTSAMRSFFFLLFYYLGRNLVKGLHVIFSSLGKVVNIGDLPPMSKVVVVHGRSTVGIGGKWRSIFIPRREDAAAGRGSSETTTTRSAKRRSRQSSKDRHGRL